MIFSALYNLVKTSWLQEARVVKTKLRKISISEPLIKKLQAGNKIDVSNGTANHCEGLSHLVNQKAIAKWKKGETEIDVPVIVRQDENGRFQLEPIVHK